MTESFFKRMHFLICNIEFRTLYWIYMADHVLRITNPMFANENNFIVCESIR